MQPENVDITKINLNRFQAYRNSRTLAKGLANLWVAFAVGTFLFLPGVRGILDTIIPHSLLLHQIIYYACLLVLAYAALRAMVLLYLFYVPPTPLKNLDAEQHKLLGVDTSRVPVPSPSKDAATTPVPTSPLAFRAPTPMSPKSPSIISSPAQAYAPAYQYYTPSGSPRTPMGGPRSPISPITSATDRIKEEPVTAALRQLGSPNTPKTMLSPSKGYAISDERALQRYLAQQEREARYKESTVKMASPGMVPAASTMATPATYVPVMPRYQPARPELTPKKESGQDQYNIDTSVALYRRLQIADCIDEWSDRMRLWLHERVLNRCVKWMQGVEERLGKEVFYHQQIGQIQSGVTTLQNRQASFFSHSPLLQLQAANPNERQLQEELLKVERYFGDFGSGIREYVVQRIRELATGACLSKYRWDGGGSFKDKPWQKEFPTDAAIMMKLFCLYMDELLAPLSPQQDHQYDAFTSRYFVRNKEDRISRLAILQAEKYPPHYNLIVEEPVDPSGNVDIIKQKGAKALASVGPRQIVEWTVMKGRNNLFHTLCLFVWYIKMALNGTFHLVNLGNYEIGLLDVVEDIRSSFLSVDQFEDE